MELSLYLHQVSTGTSSTCNWTLFTLKLSIIKSTGRHEMLGYLQYNYTTFTIEVLILKCIPEFIVLYVLQLDSHCESLVFFFRPHSRNVWIMKTKF